MLGWSDNLKVFFRVINFWEQRDQRTQIREAWSLISSRYWEENLKFTGPQMHVVGLLRTNIYEHHAWDSIAPENNKRKQAWQRFNGVQDFSTSIISKSLKDRKVFLNFASAEGKGWRQVTQTQDFRSDTKAQNIIRGVKADKNLGEKEDSINPFSISYLTLATTIAKGGFKSSALKIS